MDKPSPWYEQNRRQCSSCHAVIFWVVTVSGKRMPVDADTVPTNLDRAPTFRAGGPLRSHFATCKQAAAHRVPR